MAAQKVSSEVNRFVIICFPRTGSYMLVDLLNRQAGVTCHGEIFKQKWLELKPEFQSRLGLRSRQVASRDKDPIGHYRKVYDLTPNDITGFKIFPGQNGQALTHLVGDRTIRKVLLVRNPVQVFISLQVATVTGAWIHRHEASAADGAKQTPTVRIDIDQLAEHIALQRRFYKRMQKSCRGSHSPFLMVDYKSLLDRSAFAHLANFLGMPNWDGSVETDLKKQITARYESIVENWKDVERFMENANVSIDQSFKEFVTAFRSDIPEVLESVKTDFVEG